jgi:uncharacterized protein (DUF427 family)
MNAYPALLTPVNHVEPVPRRIRTMLAGEVVVDTIRAWYVWERPYYPQYYIPVTDVRPGLLVAEGEFESTDRGTAEWHGLQVGDLRKGSAARVLTESPIEALAGTVVFDWGALDAWFEEDERVFVHPRNPYVRVDALRSTRPVRVELAGNLLAETSSAVMVFETGLPTRYYLNRTEIDFSHLTPTDTVTECPYKGTTSGYWTARVGRVTRHDVAWCYDFPTRQLLPITGLIAFYQEKVDLFVDGVRAGPEPRRRGQSLTVS